MGTGCTTTVFSDDACASQAAHSYYTASPNPAMCVGALAEIKSAKLFRATAVFGWGGWGGGGGGGGRDE